MNAQAVVERSEALPTTEVSASLTPMQMAYHLIQNGADLGAVKEMMAMSRELAADQARQQFDEAIAAAKAEIEPVVRTRQGHNGKYADFASVASAVDPVLSRHGLSYRHRSIVADGRITVICRLAHKGGHFEETELPAPPDKTGNKNEIQAVGSTLTYLQRYTVLLALGLATAHDDDGNAAGGDRLSEDQVEALKALIDKAVAARNDTTHAEWIEYFLIHMKAPSLNAIPSKDFGKAKSTIENAIKQGAK